MPNSKFLEEYPLYRRFLLKASSDGVGIPAPPIKMFCNTCESEQTFVVSNSYYNMHLLRESGRVRSPLSAGGSSINGQVVRIDYDCASCQEFQRNFFLKFDETLSSVMKVGQYPSWDMSIDKNLSKVLKKHEDAYKKGMACEAHGYGIGAFAYYRRIVEEIIDDLLALIPELLSEEAKKKYEDALEQTKKTIIAQEKIALVKDLLPESLRPDGMNPLRILHDTLSGGIHATTDEECLEIAEAIRNALTFLVFQVSSSREVRRNFTESMRKLLDKKNQRKAS